ncbi:MAG: hypothetical protein K8R87_02550, partial [Verrucomicrobia bacterium]|nr:hypothetical protein [Verrucomicrobiota bacterium]
MSVAVPIAEPKVDASLSPQSHLMLQPNRLKSTPAWFQQRSAAAWDEYQSLPIPGNKDEHWRYSSAKKLAIELFQIAAEPIERDKQDALARSTGLAENASKLVFVNDRLVIDDNARLPQGVICLPFDEALRTQGDVLEQYLMKRKAQLGSEKFAALHLAHVRAGAVILVPKN